MSDEDILFKYSGKINSLVDAKKYDKALEIVNEALKKFPNNMELLEDKLMVFEEAEDYANAVECCDEILKINPEYWQIFRGKAYAYSLMNDLKNAIKTYDDALSLYVDDYFLTEEKIECLLKFGEIEKAEDEIKRILNKYPTDSNLWHIIGNIYLNIDDRKAIECYDRSLELELDAVAMESKLDSLFELYDINEEVQWELHEIIREYDSKFLMDEKDKVRFGPCRGKSMFEFRSVNHYFDYISKVK